MFRWFEKYSLQLHNFICSREGACEYKRGAKVSLFAVFLFIGDVKVCKDPENKEKMNTKTEKNAAHLHNPVSIFNKNHQNPSDDGFSSSSLHDEVRALCL